MVQIRVNPDILNQSGKNLESSAGGITGAGKNASGAASSAPSYDGQFGPKVKAIGAQAFSQARSRSTVLSEFSGNLQTRATAFQVADSVSIRGTGGTTITGPTLIDFDPQSGFSTIGRSSINETTLINYYPQTSLSTKELNKADMISFLGDSKLGLTTFDTIRKTTGFITTYNNYNLLPRAESYGDYLHFIGKSPKLLSWFSVIGAGISAYTGYLEYEDQGVQKASAAALVDGALSLASSALAAAAVGAAFGSIVPGAGTAVGVVVGVGSVLLGALVGTIVNEIMESDSIGNFVGGIFGNPELGDLKSAAIDGVDSAFTGIGNAFNSAVTTIQSVPERVDQALQSTARSILDVVFRPSPLPGLL